MNNKPIKFIKNLSLIEVKRKQKEFLKKFPEIKEYFEYVNNRILLPRLEKKEKK